MSCVVWEVGWRGESYRVHPGKSRVFLSRERDGSWWVQNHTRHSRCVVDDFGTLVRVAFDSLFVEPGVVDAPAQGRGVYGN
jgi:hypothetical protein